MGRFEYSSKEASSVWPAGPYEATLVNTEIGKSKAGNPMLILHFVIYGDGGRERPLKDYVVRPSGIWKLEQLAAALGREKDFEADTFDAAEHLQSNVTVNLVVRKGNEQYPKEQNQIGGYEKLARVATSGADPQAPAAKQPLTEEDIPF